MSSVLNRKDRRDRIGLKELERRKAYEAGFRAGSKWGMKRAINESTKLVLFQLLMILEEKFSFSSNSKATGKLDKVYIEFMNQVLKMNNDVDNFVRSAMQRKLEENTGLAIEQDEDGNLILVNKRELTDGTVS